MRLDSGRSLSLVRAADCKSAAFGQRLFKSTLPHHNFLGIALHPLDGIQVPAPTLGILVKASANRSRGDSGTEARNPNIFLRPVQLIITVVPVSIPALQPEPSEGRVLTFSERVPELDERSGRNPQEAQYPCRVLGSPIGERHPKGSNPFSFSRFLGADSNPKPTD